MGSLVLSPILPFLLFGLGAVCVLAIGVIQFQPHVVGILPAPRGWSYWSRMLVGQAGGLLAGLIVLLPALAGATFGVPLPLGISLALVVWLYLGLVLPRKPVEAAKRRVHQLALLTPRFLNYVQVALAGGDAPIVILQMYNQRRDARSAPLRALMAGALELMHQQRMRPFAAFCQQAHTSGCQVLIDAAEALRDAEEQGTDINQVLARQEVTIRQLQDDAFRRTLKRRTLYLLVLVALSVVIGTLGNLLYIMVGSLLLDGTLMSL